MSGDAASAPLASEVRERLAELAAGHMLPAAAAERLGTLLALLGADAHAPSSVRDPVEAVETHVADSLTGLEIPELRAAGRIADLGSGAGFPGLPLAIALPGARVTLVESNGRKCAFLARAVEAAGASNVQVVQARAEAWAEGLGACDAVTARALAALPVLLEYAAPLLRPGGVLVAWKGRRDPGDEDAAARAAALLGLECRPVVAVKGGRRTDHRHLHLYVKTTETPPRFPRRPGIAAKRPLGKHGRVHPAGQDGSPASESDRPPR